MGDFLITSQPLDILTGFAAYPLQDNEEASSTSQRACQTEVQEKHTIAIIREPGLRKSPDIKMALQKRKVHIIKPCIRQRVYCTTDPA